MEMAGAIVVVVLCRINESMRVRRISVIVRRAVMLTLRMR